MDYTMMKQWYDGYCVGYVHIYNPKSVMESILRKKFSNYWTKTETYEALRDYIDIANNTDNCIQSLFRTNPSQ